MNPDKLYLTRTDTTVGFLSQNTKRIAEAKARNPEQPFLCCVASFEALKERTRVPKAFRKSVRRAKKTTWIYPNKKAIRVVFDAEHRRFLKRFGFMYSSSANKTGEDFDEAYAKEAADIVVEDAKGFHAGEPSQIYQIGRRKKIRLR